MQVLFTRWRGGGGGNIASEGFAATCAGAAWHQKSRKRQQDRFDTRWPSTPTASSWRSTSGRATRARACRVFYFWGHSFWGPLLRDQDAGDVGGLRCPDRAVLRAFIRRRERLNMRRKRRPGSQGGLAGRDPRLHDPDLLLPRRPRLWRAGDPLQGAGQCRAKRPATAQRLAHRTGSRSSTAWPRFPSTWSRTGRQRCRQADRTGRRTRPRLFQGSAVARLLRGTRAGRFRADVLRFRWVESRRRRIWGKSTTKKA